MPSTTRRARAPVLVVICQAFLWPAPSGAFFLVGVPSDESFYSLSSLWTLL